MPRKKKDPFEGHPFGITLAGEDCMYFADVKELIGGPEGSVQGIRWTCENEICEYLGSGFLIRYNPRFEWDVIPIVSESCNNEVV